MLRLKELPRLIQLAQMRGELLQPLEFLPCLNQNLSYRIIPGFLPLSPSMPSKPPAAVGAEVMCIVLLHFHFSGALINSTLGCKDLRPLGDVVLLRPTVIASPWHPRGSSPVLLLPNTSLFLHLSSSGQDQQHIERRGMFPCFLFAFVGHCSVFLTRVIVIVNPSHLLIQ